MTDSRRPTDSTYVPNRPAVQPRGEPRRMIQRLGVEAVVARARARAVLPAFAKTRAALAEHRRVERDQPIAQRDVVFGVWSKSLYGVPASSYAARY